MRKLQFVVDAFRTTEILQETHATSEKFSWYPINLDRGKIEINNIFSSDLILFHACEKNNRNCVFLYAKNIHILRHQKLLHQHWFK